MIKSSGARTSSLSLRLLSLAAATIAVGIGSIVASLVVFKWVERTVSYGGNTATRKRALAFSKRGSSVTWPQQRIGKPQQGAQAADPRHPSPCRSYAGHTDGAFPPCQLSKCPRSLSDSASRR